MSARKSHKKRQRPSSVKKKKCILFTGLRDRKHGTTPRAKWENYQGSQKADGKSKEKALGHSFLGGFCWKDKAR